MAEQLALFEMPEPPRRTDRLFLGIMPDAKTGARIDQRAEHLRTEYRMWGKPLGVSRFHISLYSLGLYAGAPDVVVRAGSIAAAEMAAMTSPFEVTFDRLASFPRRIGKRPLVLLESGQNVALRECFHRLGAALKGVGFPYDGNLEFTPHVTLLYDQHEIEEQTTDPIRWTVNDLVLIHSLVGQSRYIERGRWAFRG